MSDSQYPPNPPPGQYPPGPPVPPVAPTSSKATTSLVLGIVSLVMCGLFLGIPAMIVARQAKREIAASQGRLGGEGLATAGFVTGLIGTIWSVLGAILLIVVIAVGGVAAYEFGQSCETVTDENGNSTITCD
jgi:Domain of unknown function (DUF4190)